LLLQLQCLLHLLLVPGLKRLHRCIIELRDELRENVASSGDATSVSGGKSGEEVVRKAWENLEGPALTGEVGVGLGVGGDAVAFADGGAG
jgi:hypothetical protein